MRNHVGEKVTEPFLRWAGGKRLLLPELLSHFPEVTDESTYYEPFLGGGAVFFGLSPARAVLSDSTAPLIETYRAVRDELPAVLRILKRMRFSDEEYYRIRASVPRTPAGHAAKFIYLNRTCFNGLYRVNLRGEFNVPVGKPNPKQPICPTDQLLAAATALADMSLVHGDFENVISQARRGDIVYCDPPYTVAHSHNGFVEYNANVFSWEDQRRLAAAAAKLAKRGVHVLVSNAEHESIRKLYVDTHGFDPIPISRWSTMAGKSAKRFQSTELLLVA